MTKSQQRAVERIKAFLQREIKDADPKYGAAVVREEVIPSSVGRRYYYRAETEYTGLPDNNLLRFLDHYWWQFAIGPKGSVEMLNGPKHFKQFAGKRVFGFKVNPRL